MPTSEAHLVSHKIKGMSMKKIRSRHGELVRTAIKIALPEATEPLVAAQVAAHPDVTALGVTSARASRELAGMFYRDSYIRRISSSGGRKGNRWAYYDERHLEMDEEKVNDVYPEPEPEAEQAEDFKFNPVELLKEQAAKAVTLTVSGVTIRIELAG